MKLHNPPDTNNVFLSFLEDVYLCLVSFIFLVINLNSLVMIVKTNYSDVKMVKQNHNLIPCECERACAKIGSHLTLCQIDNDDNTEN